MLLCYVIDSGLSTSLLLLATLIIVFYITFTFTLIENRDFFIPLAFDAPVRGVPLEYCHPVWCGKTRMVVLNDNEKNNFEDRYNRLDRIPACDR